jgi:hypothetical protein
MAVAGRTLAAVRDAGVPSRSGQAVARDDQQKHATHRVLGSCFGLAKRECGRPGSATGLCR